MWAWGRSTFGAAACNFLLGAYVLPVSGVAGPPPPAYGEHQAEMDGNPYLVWSAPTDDGTLVVAFPVRERDALTVRLRALTDDSAAAVAEVCKGAERYGEGISYHRALERVLGLPTLAALVLHRPLRRGEMETEALGYRDLDGREHMVTGVRQRPDGAIETLLTARTGFAPTVASGPEVRLEPPVPGTAGALLAAWHRARDEVLRAFPYGGEDLPRMPVPACR